MRLLWHILIVISETHAASRHLYRLVMRATFLWSKFYHKQICFDTNWVMSIDVLSIMFDKQLSRSLLHFTVLQADKHLLMSALSQVRNFAAIWARNWCDNKERHRRRHNELQTVSTRDSSLKTSKKSAQDVNNASLKRHRTICRVSDGA